MATRSIYQSNGRPLLQQALYQQKLRHGVFNSPGNPSVGVNSNASDAAALLAALTDLTVKPVYERLIAPEAQEAADAAKNGRTASFALQKTLASAAAAALGVQGGTGIPSYKLSDVYKTALANLTLLITSRTDPLTRDYRHGLPTSLLSLLAQLAAAALDIKKVLTLALSNLSRLINQRFNPALDYRSGIKLEYLTDAEEHLAEEGAAASLKHGGSLSSNASTSIRLKLFAALDVVNAKLLAAANKAAEDRLSSLKFSGPLDFKQQAQLYANALAVAQKNSNERQEAHKKGLIDLGGGLQILSEELNAMAANIVRPVLADLGVKAEEQRALDNVAKEKQQEKIKAHEEYKKEQFSVKLQEKIDQERAQKARLIAHEKRKTDADKEYEDFQAGRHKDVEEKTTALEELQAKHAEEKEALLAEKQAALDKIEEEETGLINGRKDELLLMQAEKDEEIKPTLDELEIELGKLKELTDARDALLTEVAAAEKTNAESTTKIEDLEKQLSETKAEIEEYTGKLEEATNKHELTAKEVEELQAHADSELPKLDTEEKDLDAKISELETSEKDHTDLKAQHKKDILEHLDQKVKDEHKINLELPEHLKTEVNEKKVTDTSSLFTTESKPVEPVKEAATKNEVSATPKVEKKPLVTKKADTPATSTLKDEVESKRSKAKSGFKKFSKYFQNAPPPKMIPETPAKAKVSAPKVQPATAAKKDAASVNSAAETIDAASLKNEGQTGGIFKEEI